MFRLFKSVRGFSAAEATIILSTVSILAAAAAPTMGDYVHDAKQTRARDDVRIIAWRCRALSGDVLSRAEIPGGLATLQLVVGAGDVPDRRLGRRRRLDEGASRGADVGLINDHLMSTPSATRCRARTCRRASRAGTVPYSIARIGADPWGHRYAVRFGTRPGGHRRALGRSRRHHQHHRRPERPRARRRRHHLGDVGAVGHARARSRGRSFRGGPFACTGAR